MTSLAAINGTGGLTCVAMQIHACKRQQASKAAHANVVQHQGTLQAAAQTLAQEAEAVQATLSDAWPAALDPPELSSLLKDSQGSLHIHALAGHEQP